MSEEFGTDKNKLTPGLSPEELYNRIVDYTGSESKANSVIHDATKRFRVNTQPIFSADPRNELRNRRLVIIGIVVATIACAAYSFISRLEQLNPDSNSTHAPLIYNDLGE